MFGSIPEGTVAVGINRMQSFGSTSSKLGNETKKRGNDQIFTN